MYTTLSRPVCSWLLVALALAAGCSDNSADAPAAPAVPESGAGCKDDDLDGFGEGCARGLDCDDGDAAISDQCYRCREPGTEGCACPAEGDETACGVTLSQEQASVQCGHGVSRCQGGAWTRCEVVSHSTIERPPPPGLEALGLGQASKCTNNPCDPYCQQFPDTPQGLGSSGTGIVETPAGISVPATNAPPPPSVCTGAYRACTHALCETGAKLVSGCDALSLPCSQQTFNGRTYLFCNTAQTWDNAQKACAAQGLQLTTINSAAENTWVAQQAKAINSGTNWYLGLNDRKNEGTYIWADGASLSYLNWAAGEPNDPGTEDVSEFNPNNATWVDSAGTAAKPYVCEGIPQAGGCVATVCAQRPSCCTGSWDGTCVGLAKTQCNIECAVGEQGECLTCFKDNVDHDGDGYSFQQGDCLDCDPGVNPGAYDFPGNGMDENCSGADSDEQTACDQGLPLATASADQHLKAMDLCRFTTDNAVGPSRTWGVVESKLVQADAAALPKPRQYGILDRFGTTVANDTFGLPTNGPRKGARMAVFSSGAARNPNEPDWVNPNGQYSGFSNGTFANPPAGFPKNATGCSNGTAAYDSSGVWFRVRVPTNAQSFKYNFNFYSSEYPEWVCTSFNDSYIALLTSNHPTNVINAGAPNNRNISFDTLSRPVSVNVGFFSVPGGGSILNHPMLAGTGFDGNCGGQVCGGATNWLKTQAPVLAGETITMHFSIWDTGDHVWDSTVLLDGWEWSANPSGIKTAPEIPPAPPKYYEGSFVRDYDTTDVCPQGTAVSWGLWTWTATTPTDTSIEFYVKSADTPAGLATAVEMPLRFSLPPGPAGLAGQNAVAKAATSTQSGGAVVRDTLVANGILPTNKALRVRSRLRPSSSQEQAPTLNSWNLQISCVPSE